MYISLVEVNTNNFPRKTVETIKGKMPKVIKLGPVVQSWVSANPGLKFKPLI